MATGARGRELRMTPKVAVSPSLVVTVVGLTETPGALAPPRVQGSVSRSQDQPSEQSASRAQVICAPSGVSKDVLQAVASRQAARRTRMIRSLPALYGTGGYAASPVVK